MRWVRALCVILPQLNAGVVDPSLTVRLLTPKAQPTTKSIPKSKGFAFLEFTNRNALQHALKLHHSELEGRKINIELTAGGGGKSESRLNKLKKRNKELYGQMVRCTRAAISFLILTSPLHSKNALRNLLPTTRQFTSLLALNDTQLPRESLKLQQPSAPGPLVIPTMGRLIMVMQSGAVDQRKRTGLQGSTPSPLVDDSMISFESQVQMEWEVHVSPWPHGM
jgi:hypothetical protein